MTYSRILFGVVGGMLLASGIFFKIMHWPGASILLVLGMFLITFIFLPIFFWQLYRSEMK
jgi:Flp pilus assembly protein TadB